MPSDVPPPTQVLTAVFLAWATGTIVAGALTRVWGEVHAGHFKVVWLVSAGLAVATGFGYRPAFVLAALCLATFGAIYAEADRYAGPVTAAAAVFTLAAGSDLAPSAFAGAALLGAVTNAMLLGHWHLNQPRLGTRPIARLVWVLWASLGLYLAAAGVLVAGGLSSQTGITVLGAVTALAFTAFAAILTGLVHHLVRTRSIMSATGILYLEVLLCLVAVFTGSLAALA